MSSFTPMIIPTDRPVRWFEHVNDPAKNAVPPTVAGLLLDDNDSILRTAGETLGVALEDVYPAATAGRIEWHSPFTAGRTDPIFARLDGGAWVLQPGIRNGTPPPGLHQLSGTWTEAASRTAA